MELVSRSLSSDTKELIGDFNDASDDWVEATASKVAWSCFYGNLDRAAHRIARQRRDNNAQRAAKDNSVNVIQAHTHILANCRHQLPEGVLSAVIDSLRPVAWNATHEIFDAVLEKVRELLIGIAFIERASLILSRNFRSRLDEARRLSCRLGCTCKRLHHLRI